MPPSLLAHDHLFPCKTVWSYFPVPGRFTAGQPERLDQSAICKIARKTQAQCSSSPVSVPRRRGCRPHQRPELSQPGPGSRPCATAKGTAASSGCRPLRRRRSPNDRNPPRLRPRPAEIASLSSINMVVKPTRARKKARARLAVGFAKLTGGHSVRIAARLPAAMGPRSLCTSASDVARIGGGGRWRR